MKLIIKRQNNRGLVQYLTSNQQWTEDRASATVLVGIRAVKDMLLALGDSDKGYSWIFTCEAPETQQAKAAKARWKRTSKKDRSVAAKAAAYARWKTKKATEPQNIKVTNEPPSV